MDKLASFVLSLLLVFMSSEIVRMAVSAHKETSGGELREWAPHGTTWIAPEPQQSVILLKTVGVGYKVAGGFLSTKLRGSEHRWGKVKTLNCGHSRKD